MLLISGVMIQLCVHSVKPLLTNKSLSAELRLLTSGIYCYVVYRKSTDILGEHVTSIFMAEEKPGKKPA
jgi:uncharacterized membrane protein YvlD (DUF360 family)